ncbi:MAG: hypothetical protein FJ215_10615 [Ignavibacteria bacterium]|nr:hypothetical protein [Ignavibacteria bacterium]
MKIFVMVGFFAVLLSGSFYVSSTETSAHKTKLTEARLQAKGSDLDKIRADLKTAKRSLAREGKYSCCIAPSCDFCALTDGECPCGDNLANGKPVCHECKGGWEAGYGSIEDVRAEDVKSLPADKAKMMYKMKADHYFKK